MGLPLSQIIINDIVRDLIDSFDWQSNREGNGISQYGEKETNDALVVVRLANHRCSMMTFRQRYKPHTPIRNGQTEITRDNKKRIFYSIVFNEDDYMVNDDGCWKAVCTECVFENPSLIVKESPRELIHVISNDILLILRDPSHIF